MIPPVEQQHLLNGPADGEKPGGGGLVEVTFGSRVAAVDVVSRAKEVLLVVVSMNAEGSTPASRRDQLPAWFVDACAPEPSPEEAEAWLVWWRGLDPETRRRAALDKPWSLADWEYWLQPEERQWYWWDAVTHGEHSATVSVEVLGWPAPLGALGWLLRAAGATTVDAG